MDEMRDRLIEVLKNATHKCYRTIEYIDCDNTDCVDCDYLNGTYADAILADGWIRPKFSIGQEVWLICPLTKIPFKKAVFRIMLCADGIYYEVERGYRAEHESKLYATEAEARAALEGKE